VLQAAFLDLGFRVVGVGGDLHVVVRFPLDLAQHAAALVLALARFVLEAPGSLSTLPSPVTSTELVSLKPQ
jgi:hypothetical protein